MDYESTKVAGKTKQFGVLSVLGFVKPNLSRFLLFEDLQFITIYLHLLGFENKLSYQRIQ
ncbi:MAG: hypothetical protein JRN52_02790 [Nitrososphaerota archaeon]|nr:hypothetical protein [Nitrososphaerota archaeon]